MSVPSTSSKPPSANAAIIAGAIVGGLALICAVVAIIVPLERRRKRLNQGQRSLHRAQPSGADGSTPLLNVNGQAGWSISAQQPRDPYVDDVAAQPEGHSRGRSASESYTVPLTHELGTYTPTRSQFPTTVSGDARLDEQVKPPRKLTDDSMTSPTSEYTRSSASRVLHDMYYVLPADEVQCEQDDTAASSNLHSFPNSPTMTPSTAPQLPQITRLGSLNISELLQSRAQATKRVAIPRNATGDSIMSDDSSYSQASASTNIQRQISRMLSRGRSQSSEVTLGLSQSLRAGPSMHRSRPPKSKRTPMEPVMENPHSRVTSDAAINVKTDSALNPVSASTQTAENSEISASPRPQTPNSMTAFGFGTGISLLTSAFRKSLSASSILTESSNSNSNSNNSEVGPSRYPSVAGFTGPGMGASALGRVLESESASSRGSGSFYTAASEFGVDNDDYSRPPSLRPSTRHLHTSKSNLPTSRGRDSTASYPSIPSLASATNVRPPRSAKKQTPHHASSSEHNLIPPVPPLPTSLTPGSKNDGGPRILSPPLSSLEGSGFPDLNSKPEVKLSSPNSKSTTKAVAHLRDQPARHTGTEVAESTLSRGGHSTHAVIETATNRR